MDEPEEKEAPDARYKELGVVQPGREKIVYKEVAVIPKGKSAVVILPTDQVKSEIDLPPIPPQAEK